MPPVYSSQVKERQALGDCINRIGVEMFLYSFCTWYNKNCVVALEEGLKHCRECAATVVGI